MFAVSKVSTSISNTLYSSFNLTANKVIDRVNERVRISYFQGLLRLEYEFEIYLMFCF
jgi:hypothetical protein